MPHHRELKYVITDTNAIAIFDTMQTHADMARVMHGNPIGAGFLAFTEEDGVVRVRCYGKSISLDVRARENDAEIINRKLGLVDLFD